MNPSERYWQECISLAEACLEHPFLQGIASGELPRGRFAFYVGQDAFFLNAFARAYALALAKAPDESSMQEFRLMLDEVFRELELHAGYARAWGVDLQPEPAAATLAYTDFLLRVAWGEPAGCIVAAMTPCMRLYAYLGQRLKPVLDPDSPYKEWVETYSHPDFEQAARRIERLLDRFAGDSTVAAGHYRRAMERELAFFQQAWERPLDA